MSLFKISWTFFQNSWTGLLSEFLNSRTDQGFFQDYADFQDLWELCQGRELVYNLGPTLCPPFSLPLHKSQTWYLFVCLQSFWHRSGKPTAA